MRARRTTAAVWAVVACLGSPAHAAVTEYLGKPIAAVTLLVEGRQTTEPALVQVVETVAGRPLSMADVRESVTHLFSLGRFEDVRVDAELTSAGVTLRYELSPIHPVTRILFAGNVGAAGVDARQLRRAVVDRYGASPPLGRATDLARIVTDVLHERGYLHADVRPRADVSHRPERASLVFTIEPGQRTLIGLIQIVGLPDASRGELLNTLGVTPGAPYQRDALNARIERYLENRRSRGYYEAKVMPIVELADGDRLANITFSVEPGPHVRVAFAGDPLPADRRGELVPVEREGSADEDLLEDASARIEEYLQAQGYRDASAPHTREQSGDQLLITFTVRKGPLNRVSRVEISGNASVPLGELDPGLRLRDGQPFSGGKLAGDIAVIEDVYHRHGFAAVKAESGISAEPAPRGATEVPVVVRIVIREGVRTVVGSVRFTGNRALDGAALQSGLLLQPDRPFVVAQLAADRDAIQSRYANLGFANATVDARPETSRDGTRADILFTIREGPQIFVDHVLIVGNVRTSTATIERELQIKPGDPLGRDAVYESQRRLSTLGLFRRSAITEVGHGDETRRDVLVTVEEAPARTLGYGGGGELLPRVIRSGQDGGVATERYEFAPRAFAEIGWRNLFGKNRSVNLFNSISLHTKDPESSSGTGYGLTEYRVIATYREPRLLDTRADAFVNATVEQQIRTGFDFRRRSASAEVARHVTRALGVSGNYVIQRTEVFNEDQADKPLIDLVFPQVLLSSFSSTIVGDTRDDQVDPHAGGYVSTSGQLAARRIGSEVGFVKSFFTAQEFRTLPHTNRIVFAGSARVGLAAGFPREGVDAEGTPVTVRDLPPSERFYAGGDTTVRGFALDRLGVSHDPPQPSDTIDNTTGLPIGGNALVIFNAELRVPVRGGFGVVGFVDTGNVFQHASDLQLSELRSAVGFGIRYRSPFGPIRIDLGFKVRRQEIAGQPEGATALHISFGQAF